MIALERSKGHKGKCMPNILPCRINHNGTVDVSGRYWNPSKTTDGKTVAYFRGRKLHGKRLKIPSKYRGVVVSSTDRILPKTTLAPETIEEDEEVEVEPDVKVMEEQSQFNEIMIWGHESLPEDTADPYMKGIEEWISFAEQIHSFDDNNKAS